MNTDTIIIGAGPAGIAAAIQLKRANHNFIIIEKGPIGGLILNANLVENYPGFHLGISGPDLAGKFVEHLSSINITITQDKVIEADYVDNQFIIKTEKSVYMSNNLIVAAGTKAKEINQNAISYHVDKIYYEIYEIRNIKGKVIAIIGGGDTAFDYAINLSKKNKVHLIWRSEKPRCLPLLYKRASHIDSIKMYPGMDFSKLPLEADYIVAAIGREPAIDFLSPKIKNHFLENIPCKGLYFAGDIARGQLRQCAIAVGDGIRAAMEIINITL